MNVVDRTAPTWHNNGGLNGFLPDVEIECQLAGVVPDLLTVAPYSVTGYPAVQDSCTAVTVTASSVLTTAYTPRCGAEFRIERTFTATDMYVLCCRWCIRVMHGCVNVHRGGGVAIMSLTPWVMLLCESFTAATTLSLLCRPSPCAIAPPPNGTRFPLTLRPSVALPSTLPTQVVRRRWSKRVRPRRR